MHVAVHRPRGRRRRGRAARANGRRVGRHGRRVADAAHHPLKLKRLDGDRLLPYLEDDRLTPSHELERLWVRNGSVYVFRRDVVERGLEADDVRGYEMPPERSFDIDTAEDLAFARVPRRAGRAGVIPRVFHQIWLGEEPFPYGGRARDLAAPPPRLGAPALDGA